MKKKRVLTEATIRRYVGEQSFTRGRRYFENEAISHERKQGQTLKARCAGSYRNGYQVQITLTRAGTISTSHCSCPIGGSCKHVAALLLAWLKAPNNFVPIEEIDAALDERSKPELITLLKHMLKRQPDLEVLLETPLPGTKHDHDSVSPDIYYRQAHEVIMNMEDDGSIGIPGAVTAIKEIGDEFKQQESYAFAVAIYEGIIRAISDTYQLGYDDEGDVDEIMEQCVEELQQCFGKLANATQREEVLRILWIAWQCDMEYCGNLSESIPQFIGIHASQKEQDVVTTWVNQMLAKRKDTFYRDSYEQFLRAMKDKSS